MEPLAWVSSSSRGHCLVVRTTRPGALPSFGQLTESVSIAFGWPLFCGAQYGIYTSHELVIYVIVHVAKCRCVCVNVSLQYNMPNTPS